MQKRILYIAFLLLAICNKIVGANGVDQITISNFSIYSGQSKEIAVELTNTESYVGFQFDLSLPQGVTVDSCWADSKRIPAGTSLRMAQQTDGSYRFVAAALDGTAITGNSGTVVNITVKAGDNLTEGSYTGYIRDIKLSKADGSGTTIAEQPFTITVKGNEAYAALSENNTVLTFYYDKKKEERNGMDIGPFTSSQDRGWYSTAANITTVVFDASFNAYRPTSTAYWFDDSFKLETITDIKYLHTDEVTSMGNMFAGCERLSSINLSGFNTEKVTNMSLMFFSCSRLTAINVSAFNTASVTNMEGLFSGCSGLTDINVGNFNTAGVTNMNNMFNDCTGLTKLDLSSFNTRNVTWMQWTFNGLTNLKTIYVGDGWTNANVNRSEEMFTGSTALVGGQGTVYDANHVDADYAHIDGGTANPGYFTPKNGYGQAATPTFTHDGNLVFAHSTTEGATIRYTIDGEAPTETTGLIYNDSIRVVRNCTIRAIATRENFTPSDVAEYSVNWFKVANVEFAQNGHTITLTTQTDSATIHYTLSNSGTGEQIYTAPLTLDADGTIEAYATRAGYLPSDTTNFVFHADGVTCSNPVFARNGNVITISTQTENAQIYYTTDGTVPTDQSQLYTDSIIVANNMTIKAIAMRANYYPSQVTTFVVDWFKCEKPVVTWNGNQLTATTTTEGAIIQYSLTQPGVETPLDQGGEASPLQFTVTQDAIINLYAVKTGWTNSDTLVIDYPYTAWQALLSAIGAGQTVSNNAEISPRVSESMKSDLKALIAEAQEMYSLRTAAEADITHKAEQIHVLAESIQRIIDQVQEAYAVLSADNTTLTFYYDYDKGTRNGMSVGPFTAWAERGWNDNRTDITTVVFDSTFVNYRPTSTAYWFYLGQNITSINGMQYLNTSEVTNMAYMFGECRQLASLDLSNFNTEKVTNMNTMFLRCRTLTNLDVSTFNTEKVTDMSTMFYGCSGLTSLDLSNFKTENVTEMWGMFQECSGLTSLNISSFNTSKADINQMFTACSSLTSIDVRNLDISATPALSFLFSECSSLKTLDLTTFNTSNVTYFMGMFQGCTSLTDVKLSNFNTENGVSMAQMFYGCSSLERIDLSSFNTSNVTSFGMMFYDCKNLRTIYVGDGWTTSKIDQEEYSRKDVFLGCTNLVGGMGTAYDSLHVDYTYAHIDGGPDNPGYFTDINSGVTIYVQASEAPYLYAFDADGNALNGQFPGNLMTDTATVNGQLFYKTRIYRSVPFNINILDKDLYRTREIYVISDRYFVYEGTSKYVDVTNSYGNAPEIEISSLALPGNHNYWDKMQLFEVVEAGKKYSMQIDLGDMTFEDNLLQFKLYANACAWLGVTSLVLDAPDYVHSIGNPELIASDRNIVIDLASAPTREFKFEATWNGGTQMEEGWTLKITGVSAVDEPYAVLSDSNTVLTFYYDKKKQERNGMSVGPYMGYPDREWNSQSASITTVEFDASFANCTTLSSTDFWFSEFTNLKKIVGMGNLNTSNVLSMVAMFQNCSSLTNIDLSNFSTASATNLASIFYGCTSLTSIDVSNFNTENVYDMQGIFNTCTNLKTIDISNFKTSKATNMAYMFQRCYALTTIYVGDGWTTSEVGESIGMFNGCSNLVGGLGTVYDANHVDAEYAHIDGGPTNPGYFTDINGPSQKVAMLVADNYEQSADEKDAVAWFQQNYVNTNKGIIVKPSTINELDIEKQSVCWVMCDRIGIEKGWQNLPGGLASNEVITALKSFTASGGNLFLTNHATQLTVALGRISEAYGPVIFGNGEGGQNNDIWGVHPIIGNVEGQIYDHLGHEIYQGLTYEPNLYAGIYCFEGAGVKGDHNCMWDLNAYGLASSPNVVKTWEETTNSTVLGTWNHVVDYCCAGIVDFEPTTTFPARILAVGLASYEWNVGGENAYQDQLEMFTANCLRYAATPVIKKVPTPTLVWNADTLIVSSATEGALIEVIKRFTSDGDVAEWAGWANPVRVELGDHYYEIWAHKEGWMDSDTLKFYYPYTAWHELLDAVDKANAAIQQTTGNDNVPVQMLNELKALTDEAQTMYSQRTANETSIQDKTAQIRELTDAIVRLANAEAEPYAVLTGDTISGMTLTFYYDKKKEERNGMGVGPFTSSEDRGWHGNSMPSNITTVVFDSSFDNYRPTSTAFWFTGMHSLTAIVDIQYLQTQNVTNMNCMFYDCNALTSLDVTGFNTQNVTDMGGMFWGCSALTSLDVTGFNTQNVTDMGAMFRYCSGLTSLDVTGFNTQNATYMGAMFWGCSALTSLDVTDFNTQNVTNMGFMFYDCFALTSIDVTGFNTQNVTYMESMFDGCSALTSLNLLGLNTENVTNMGAMFARCKGLTSLDLSHFDTQNVTNMSSMFWNCPSLTVIYVGSGWTTGAVTNSDDMFSGCTSLVGGKGTAYDATHVDHTYAHIDGGPSNPGYFTDKNAPVIDYAYDGTSGVLTVSGGTTMVEALNAAGGREEVAKTLTSIIWNNTMPLTNSDLQGLDNPNMLIYVQSDSLAPTNRDNVVVNGFAKNIVLTDVAEGNGDFYCPQAFTAEMISYTRNFLQQTEVGVSRGWETIALPFAVQTIMHEKNGLIAPFGSAASNKHFWLRQIPMDGVTTGLTQATQILANVPYLISMPNSDAYPAEFNQAGRVTFSSMNVEVPVTTASAPTVPVAGTMIALTPTMKRVAAGQQVYALNVGNAQEGYAEGSVFVAGLRDVRPFEAYTVHNGNGPAPRYVPVNTLGEGSTGIETIDHSPLTNDQWYDLNGRKLQQKPTQKGLYILNGKTVVVK